METGRCVCNSNDDEKDDVDCESDVGDDEHDCYVDDYEDNFNNQQK